MTRRDLDSRKLKTALHQLDLSIRVLTYDVIELGAKIEQFQQQKSAKEDLKGNLEFEREMAQRALVIVKNIPDDVLDIRQRMQFLSFQMGRKDLRVDKIEKYKQELERLEKEIKSICGHPLIVEYSGGHDSDEGTSWPGSRMCVLCCFEEEGTFVSSVIPMLGTRWNILAKHPERILCRRNSGKLEKILCQDNRWSIPTEDIIEFFLDDRMLTVQDRKPLKHLKLGDIFKKVAT